MHNAFVLVLDSAPDSAEKINSQLRNAGLSVRTLKADNASEARRLAVDFSPSLLIYMPGAESSIPIEDACDLARERKLFLAIAFTPGQSGAFSKAVAEYPCIGIQADNEKHLVTLVNRLVTHGRASSDMSELRNEQEDLLTRYQLLMDSTREAIAYFHEGLHVFANRAYLDAMNASSLEELEPLSLLEVAASPDVDMKSMIRDFGQGVFPEEPLDMTITSPGHGEFSAQLLFSPVPFNGEASVQMVMRRGADESKVDTELRQMRSQDPLTGTNNRNAFMDQLQTRLDRTAADRSAAVFHVQPDDFASIEKSVSVYQADSLIKGMAHELRQLLQSEDLLGRFSDNAFTVHAVRSDRTTLRALADSLRASVAQFLAGAGLDQRPTGASVGLVMIGPQTNDAEEVIAHTRLAWEQAAETGDEVVRYHPSREELGDEDGAEQWEKRIRYALNNDDFYSVQQSIVNLEGESDGLFENRTFLHEDAGDLPTEEFMPAAEGFNLGSTIDRQVIPGLLRAISGTGDRHIINLSANSVHDFSFPAWFHRQLQEHNVEGSQIILQIPATAAVTHMRAARRLFDEMKPLDCGFSLSQFNDRRQNIDILDQLAVSLVKLEPGLTENLKSETDSQNSIRNVVTTAEKVGTQVLADNVQNSSDMAILWQCGVKLVAGAFLQGSPRVIGQ